MARTLKPKKRAKPKVYYELNWVEKHIMRIPPLDKFGRVKVKYPRGSNVLVHPPEPKRMRELFSLRFPQEANVTGHKYVKDKLYYKVDMLYLGGKDSKWVKSGRVFQ